MAKKSTRTIYGALLQTAQRFNQPLPILANSTLNQKFDVFPDLLPGEDEMPFTNYLAIGLKGITVDVNENGLYVTKYREYSPRWASLLLHCPFIMRPVLNDLTSIERSQYRLRRIEVHNGTTYACYYLRVLDLNTGIVGAEYRTIVNDIITSQSWTPTLSDLNPLPLEPNPNEVILTGDDYIAATKKIALVFTPQNIQEIMDAVNIIYGSPDVANITEFALCSGVDRVLTGDFNGIPAAYTEVVAAQVNDFVKATLSCPNATLGQTINVDAGSNEPLLVYNI